MGNFKYVDEFELKDYERYKDTYGKIKYRHTNSTNLRRLATLPILLFDAIILIVIAFPFVLYAIFSWCLYKLVNSIEEETAQFEAADLFIAELNLKKILVGLCIFILAILIIIPKIVFLLIFSFLNFISKPLGNYEEYNLQEEVLDDFLINHDKYDGDFMDQQDYKF